MQVKCIHEVYFEPKMFQTIGFHHQGRYNISTSLYSINKATKQKTYGYPMTYFKNSHKHQSKQEKKTNKNDAQSIQYHTNKFDVSFNEQQFFFNTSSKFILQIPTSHLQNIQQSSGSKEVLAGSNQEKNNRKQPLYLLIKLIKYNEQQSNGNKSQDHRGMSSSENIIKSTVEDNIKQVQIQKKIKKQGSMQSDLKKNNINLVEKVNEVILQIQTSISSEEKQSLRSMYQQIALPEQHYFGKLYFLISHTQIGYRMRPKNYTLLEFNPLRNSIITETSSVYNRNKRQKNNKMAGSNQLIKTEKLKQEIEQKINLSSLSAAFEAIYDSFSDQFQQLIRKQIIELNRIERISIYLVNSLEQQNVKNGQKISKLSLSTCTNQSLVQTTSTSSNRNSSSNLQGMKCSDLNICICVPETITDDQSIFQYYECQNRDQLHQILYQQHNKLSHFISYKWHNIINMLSQNQWNSFYYFQTIINFRQTSEYLIENKVHQHLITEKDRNAHEKEEQEKKIKFIPCFKYKFYVYDQIPDLYMKKTMKVSSQRPHTFISSEHILFILVHGFNGNQHDMNRIKSFISYFSTPHFLVLKNISDNILQSLDSIGKIAAEEILSYLKPRPFIHRINFVGFSLGGVIIRACLPYLKQYYRIFNMFITLSSPHLGVKQVNNCIVQTGLKLLNRVKGVKNIKQLMLDLIKNQDDNSNTEGKDNNGQQQLQVQQLSYLQKLALHSSIGVFSLVVVCGSLDDKYVPGYSSTLDYQGSNQKIISMQGNLKANIVNLHQVYVKFNKQKKGTLWDQLTGRRVHINFLDDDSFLHFLIGQYFHLF